MADFIKRKSVFGRHLYVTSSGGVGGQTSSSTGFNQVAQMWGDGMVQTAATAADLVTNYGVTIVSSDSTSGVALVMAAGPQKGLAKSIVFNTSATLMTLNTNSTNVKFNSTLAYLIGNGSTVLNITGVAAGLAGVLNLVGVSTAAWAIQSRTVASSS